MLMNFSFIILVSSDIDSFVVVILLFSRTSTVITRCTFLSDLLINRCSKVLTSSAEVRPLGNFGSTQTFVIVSLSSLQNLLSSYKQNLVQSAIFQICHHHKCNYHVLLLKKKNYSAVTLFNSLITSRK